MDEIKAEKMRLGRKAAYLRRCLQTQELLEAHETPTTIRKRVFDIHIRPVIHCSYTSFNNMLNEPNPARQLEALESDLNKLNNHENL